MERTLYIVDTNHLCHLMWHMARAKIEKETGDKEALPDPADVLDWIMIRLDNLHHFWKQIGPLQCVAVFDGPSKPFRNELFTDYKAGRDRKPEVYVSVNDAQLALKNSDEWGMIVSPPGYEADDLMASIAHQHQGPVVIHSPDKDMNQCLVEDRVSIIKRSSQEELGESDGGYTLGSVMTIESYDTTHFARDFPFPVSRWVDYQCLVGDSADNIKGAEWIGHVAACRILGTMHTLAELEDIDVEAVGLNKRQVEAWSAFIDRRPMLRELFTLHNDLHYQI